MSNFSLTPNSNPKCLTANKQPIGANRNALVFLGLIFHILILLLQVEVAVVDGLTDPRESLILYSVETEHEFLQGRVEPQKCGQVASPIPRKLIAACKPTHEIHHTGAQTLPAQNHGSTAIEKTLAQLKMEVLLYVDLCESVLTTSDLLRLRTMREVFSARARQSQLKPVSVMECLDKCNSRRLLFAWMES